MKSTGLVFAEKPSIGIEPTRLYDRSRFGNHGVHTDITMGQRPSGLWVRSFNGTSSYVDLGSDVSIKNFSAITILFWFKGVTASGLNTILDSGYWAADYGYYAYMADGTNTISTKVRDKNGAVSTGTETFTNNVWVQSGLTYDRATLYSVKNGALAIGGVQNADAEITSSQNPLIGRRSNDTVDYLTGKVGLLRIYNYALSAGQIKKIFEAERHWFGR